MPWNTKIPLAKNIIRTSPKKKPRPIVGFGMNGLNPHRHSPRGLSCNGLEGALRPDGSLSGGRENIMISQGGGGAIPGDSLREADGRALDSPGGGRFFPRGFFQNTPSGTNRGLCGADSSGDIASLMGEVQRGRGALGSVGGKSNNRRGGGGAHVGWIGGARAVGGHQGVARRNGTKHLLTGASADISGGRGANFQLSSGLR